MKYCPMKFINLTQTIKFFNSIPEDFAFKVATQCQEQDCAWYHTYPNGEGECAIHSLPGLFDGLDSIATQIATK